jgi:cytochrome P450
MSAQAPSLVAAIGQLELFEGLSDNELARIAEYVDRLDDLHEGDTLCSEGSRADCWWIVLDGQADASINGLFVGSVGAGETVGEIAALDGSERTATVIARTPLQVAVVSTERFDALLDVAPSISRALLRQVARRVRNVSAAASSFAASATRKASDAGSPQVPVVPVDAAVFLSDEFFAKPYSTYASMAAQGPAVFNDIVSSWVITGYDDVTAVMRDRTASSNIANATSNPFVESSRAENVRLGDPATVSRFDGEDHMRIRRLVAGAFTPRRMQAIKDDIEAVASQLLEAAAAQGETDFVDSVALPLPSTVISRLLGVPLQDLGQLHEWSTASSQLPEPMTPPEERAKMMLAIEALRGYMLDLAERKRRDPGDDVMSAMVHAEADGARLSRSELVDNAALLYVAGHITTTFLLSSMVSLLDENPDQRALLTRTPALQANTVEEVLRIEPPTQFGRRFLTAPMTMGSTELPAGASLITAIGAANHDRRHWGDDADEFRVDRAGAHQHVSFAAGPHFCAGAALARLEGQIVLNLLMSRYPNFAVMSPERQWGRRIVLRGLEQLPVRLVG